MDMKKMITSKIKELGEKEKTIIVLKGINPKEAGIENDIDIELLLNDKFLYYMNLYKDGRNIITYDEYVGLYNFIIDQYEKVIILENNLYINYYPMYVTITEDTLEKLLVHYDTEKEGDKYFIDGITELTAIYSNIKSINEEYYVVYNKLIKDEKEEIVYLFDINRDDKKVEDVKLSDNCYKVINEEDYLFLLKSLENKRNEEIYILANNTSINKVVIEQKIKLLREIYKDEVNIKVGILKDNKRNVEVRQEFKDILKRYWGYNSFKTLEVYDQYSLSRGKKVIKEISQAEIINDIVEQTEKCINRDNSYQDIFVTAPTGAGKSIIFQIPAIYIAEKYDLFTIVISPLIGLMKDQVDNLKLHSYNFARTINSDISPIQKQEIINDIIDKKCNILYLSPESLLSKSDLDQIIGNRTLGLVVIDESHIVTTWGKQFRPDYWYLGEYLSKMRKAQMRKDGKEMGFVIATFTATAIYGGLENMYEETVQSLEFAGEPIVHLGNVKRKDIDIKIENAQLVKGKVEYERNKFDDLTEKIREALLLKKKMLIYFPTVSLIERFWTHCFFNNLSKDVSKYHGQLSAFEKDENFQKFLSGETPIMLATKAFGMGIDIDDIEVVAHFAPTGNVCDYVQEIGRVARRADLKGEAFYRYMSNDFKHINKLHGLSQLKKYQLIEVIKKVYELYNENLKKNRTKGRITKKRNSMLVDAESFAHIFENPFFNEDDGINKVKTAMLLIQKDFETRFSFSPFHIRPIPLFEMGYFMIEAKYQAEMKNKYGDILSVQDEEINICSVNLKRIWEYEFNSKYSFPKFKYMIYSKDDELDFEYKNYMKSALNVEINFEDNYFKMYEEYINVLKSIVNKSIREKKYYNVDGEDGLVEELQRNLSINKYKSKSIIETLLSAMSVYQRDFSKNINSKVLITKVLQSNDVEYMFTSGTAGFFRWIENSYKDIKENCKDGVLYLVNDTGSKSFKETLMILGILETFGILTFSALGGSNSQIYIYVNQTKTMKEIIDKPYRYRNRLLEKVSDRHEMSVLMMKYIFEGNFSSDEIWDIIEDYFLGIIPEKVQKLYDKRNEKKKLKKVYDHKKE